MSQLSHDNNFCDLLFTKPLAHYFSCVYESNMNGFNSSEPAPGVWEVYVYEQSNFRSVGKRMIREKFIDAVQMLGQHLNDIDVHTSGSSEKSTEILKYIREHDLTSKQTLLFDMFFNIVDDSKRNNEGKATHVSIGEYKRNVSSKPATNMYRVNVKTVNKSVTVPNAFSNNYKVLSGQQGAGIFKDSLSLTSIALITGYIPLVQTSVGLPTKLEFDVKDNRLNYVISSSQQQAHTLKSMLEGQEDRTMKKLNEISGEFQSLKRSTEPSQTPSSSGSGEALGGGLKGGTVEQDRAEVLRLLCEYEFENHTDTSFTVPEVVSAVEIASYIACHPEPTNAPSVLSNAVTLAALPTNTWRKLSDGSYEKKTPEGVYKPLSAEECAKLLSTCAGSSLNGTVCKQFMDAVRDQNVGAILELLASSDIWNSNAAADSLNDLHPETVLKILKTLKFGTKNGPYGKRVCSVDEWLAECVKNTDYASASASTTISPSMKSYLNHLVSFVNSNPSLIDPSKRPLAGRTTQNVTNVFTERGIVNVYDVMERRDNNMVTFEQAREAVNANTYGVLNPAHVYPYGTVAFGGAQQGGNHAIYTQSAQAPISLGSGISQLVQQTLNGLRSTSQQVSPADEALIKEKVEKLTHLEQDIYQNIIQLNNYRVAVESGIDCHSQLTSTQDNLMHLSNSYNRKVPCLQELCEQLRMLLAQQQHKQGCEPIQ
jgi:hypothetical protein